MIEENIGAADLLEADERVTIIDIRREPDEMQIPGSLRYDGEALADAASLPFADDAQVVLDGGYRAWKEAGLPIEPIGAPLELD